MNSNSSRSRWLSQHRETRIKERHEASRRAKSPAAFRRWASLMALLRSIDKEIQPLITQREAFEERIMEVPNFAQ